MSPRRHAGQPVARRRNRIRFELRCTSCGYGVVVGIAPEKCPMCAGSVWEHARRLTAA